MKALTVKPLLWVIGVLFVICVVLVSRGCALAADVRAANAATDTAQANVRTAVTERDAWKTRAEDNARSASVRTAERDLLADLLDQQQNETVRLVAEGEAAVARAQDAARDADRTLKAFTAQFQAAARTADCGAALTALNNACPTLRDY